MDSSIINTISLCTGVGMLDEGFRLGCEYLGLRTRTAMCGEWEGYAAACLLARMEEQSMEPAPIWCGDLRDLDCLPFRGSVDAIIAGLPCQPYSCAGKQQGLADQRSYGDGDGPIPNFLRIVSECDPALVFCENVPPWVRGGWFRPVGEELCGLGYTLAEPKFVTAESVGASHRRERVFVLAYRRELAVTFWQRGERRRISRDLAGSRGDPEREARQRERRGDAIVNQNQNLDDSDGSRPGEPGKSSERQPQQQPGRSSQPGGRCESVGNTQGIGGRGGFAGLSDAHGRGESEIAKSAMGNTTGRGSLANPIGSRPQERRSQRSDIEPQFSPAERSGSAIFAPGPGADWASIHEYLWPAVEPGFRLLVDGHPVVLDQSRTDQLRCAGNGCVPLAAAVAFVELVKSAGGGERAGKE